jgi:hypothetical protein
MPLSISELGGYTRTQSLQSFYTSQLNGDANSHGALCLGYLHNAARKRSVMHSSICAMETRNLLDSNKVTTCLQQTTPLLAGRSARAQKLRYGLLHVVAESNHTHCHCSMVTMPSAYKVYPANFMFSSATAWFSRTRSNAARSAASTCKTSYLFIEVLAFSSSCGRTTAEWS